MPAGEEFDVSLFFPDPSHAEAVGRRVLAQYPQRSRRGELLAGLDLPSIQAGPIDRAAWADWFTRAQRRDFDQGHVVIVNNWVLSRTEAALCALAALA